MQSSSFGEEKLPKVPEYEAEELEEERQRAKERASQHAKASEEALQASPSDAAEAVEGTLLEVFRYTSRHLMRVYPAGWRVDSSNYNPFEAWVRGASLAALNWQNWAKPLWFNQALVRAAP